MVTNAISQKVIRPLLVALLYSLVFSSMAHALHPMYDMRYTQGPELLSPNAFHAGAGFQTFFEGDLAIPATLQVGISPKWEMGGKLALHTYNRLDRAYGFFNLGAKYKYTSYATMHVDTWLGLNNDQGGALVLGYTRGHTYTSRFSSLYEVRTGFFDAATGPDGFVMISGGAYPTFKIADSFRLRIGTVAGGSLGNLQQDFQADLIPGMEVGLLGHLRLNADCAIGVLQQSNNDRVRLSVHVTTKI